MARKERDQGKKYTNSLHCSNENARLPSCGKQVWFVLRNPFACGHNGAFLGRKASPFRPCTVSPCAGCASDTVLRGRKCVVSWGHSPGNQKKTDELCDRGNNVHKLAELAFCVLEYDYHHVVWKYEANANYEIGTAFMLPKHSFDHWLDYS